MTLFHTASGQGTDAVEFLVPLARAPDPATVAFSPKTATHQHDLGANPTSRAPLSDDD
jgi:hypothetical protein